MNDTSAVKPTITIDDFIKLDMRVGRVVEASVPEWSQKLIELHVDFGPELGMKTIFSAIQAYYSPADFTQKLFPFIVNLAERKMGEGVSQGMMIMADGSDRPIITPLPEGITPGTIIR